MAMGFGIMNRKNSVQIIGVNFMARDGQANAIGKCVATPNMDTLYIESRNLKKKKELFLKIKMLLKFCTVSSLS